MTETRNGYEFHELADLFPMMGLDEFDNLCSDIQINGLLEPIVLYEGRILDGRNRWEACNLVGIKHRFVEYGGECGTPLQYVISKNLNRRHLSSDQRACIAQDILPKFEVEAKERAGFRSDLAENFPGGYEFGDAADKISELVGTNSKYIRYAKKLKQDAPDLFEKVKSGREKLYKAIKELQERNNVKIIRNRIEIGPHDLNGNRRAVFLGMIIQAIKDSTGVTDFDEHDARDFILGNGIYKDDFDCKWYCDLINIDYGIIEDWALAGFSTIGVHQLIINQLERQLKE